jgi:hypothetical protein
MEACKSTASKQQMTNERTTELKMNTPSCDPTNEGVAYLN